jgi:hypothetical protein
MCVTSLEKLVAKFLLLVETLALGECRVINFKKF